MNHRFKRKSCFEALESRRLLAAVINELEPNNSISHATPVVLPSDGQVTLIGAVAPGDSRDFFRLTPEGDFTGQLSINVRGNGPKPRLEIQTTSGSTIFQTKPDDNINSGTINIIVGQTYYIRLRDESIYEVDLSMPLVQHALDDFSTVVEGDESVVIDVLANDVGASHSDPKAVLSVEVDGMLGNVEISSNGQELIYTPGTIPGLEAGQSVIQSFSYTLGYGNGAFTDSATVFVEVIGANHQPTAQNDSVNVLASVQSIRLDVLENDSDPDVFDTLRIIDIESNSASGLATISADGTAVEFEIGDFYDWLSHSNQLVETLSYTVEDDWGARSTALVTIVVIGVDDPPVAVNDSVSIQDDNQSIGVDVLANDFDPDLSDEFFIVSATSQAGSVTIAADAKSIEYLSQSSFLWLADGESESDVVTYTVRDQSGLESTATLTITIFGTNQSPIAFEDQFEVSEDATVTFLRVLDNDQDVDLADTKRVVSVQSSGTLGTFQVASNRTGLVFINNNAYHFLSADQSINEIVTYIMEDAAGLQSTATAAITIQGTNDSPIAVTDSFSVQENYKPYRLSVLANDWDVDIDDNDTLRVVEVDGSETPGYLVLIIIYGVGVGFWVPGTPAVQGTLAVAPDGKSVLYTPGSAFDSLARLFPFSIRIERHIGIGKNGFLAQEFVTYHSYKPRQGSRYELRSASS